jgi:hypothetical protein
MKQVDESETRRNGLRSDPPFEKKARSTKTHERISKWVREHRVCFEVAPLVVLKNTAKCQIGFTLNVYAQHPHLEKRPKDKEWIKIYLELEEIVQAVLPDEQRCRCEIQSFDNAVRIRPETGLKPEVQLAIIIGHRHNIFEPVDKLQEQCVAEIQAKLLQMGAQPRAWPNENKPSGE